MPIYEYRCTTCDARFSRLFRSLKEAEEDTIVCPACGSADVRRLISRVAVHTGGASPAAEGESSSEPEKPAVFGRKELQEIMRQREQWKQEVEAGD